MEIINIESWNRKEHFEFFSRMASPYFGITTEVDCTIAYDNAKENGNSFFAHYLHKSMIAVNSVEELRLRIVDNKVALFEKINAGATVGRADGTFGFIFVNFSDDFETFNKELQNEIQTVLNSTGLRLNDDDIKKDLIRHSTIPWTSFTGLLHPTNFDRTESVPKITFGKFSIREGKKYLPVSIEAHHGLVDGFHLAKYLSEFQRQLDKE
ncbi:chloramphenicol acetyltransferase [Flavobacterium psychrophilum]|uniref:chloramphenicol acetyltransferase n=1 Tax=Flavobacteriaceae TaxID=49546 RepID=UPI0020970839|nr:MULTISPECIES: chloramphenicol acetyltransferase [Myroides]MCO7724006.1 chloramphenicol acetyltransferase [Myroides odoratimimus]MDM1060652.1 chloramphenicol acetyltransferase [Myroides odoratimimus]MDM1067453.1 chloramphenicol acetyltransferase [Myroides odoratimimus]MDM1098369.1 chloramphenicol acetyltransferase [Myroides odoratimimus]MDM1391410.1 chloramphenicol acetyltransferase [Myroides marinus]|tara:strand:+ start:189 stop:818 length:630 start_codon:yes stop_codon:yes gene_type:complete